MPNGVQDQDAEEERCNTPDVIYLICIPTLAVSGTKLFLFSPLLGFWLRVLLPLSCISYHVIVCIAFAYVFVSCIRAFSPLSVLHSALLCHPVVLSTSFRVWGLNISGLDRDLPCGLCLLPVDRLSSFVPFGLRLILQRLTEGPRKPRLCCSPTPFQLCPKPTKTSPIV